MLRIIKRNTTEENCLEDLDNLKVDLINSGYNKNMLDNIQSKAFERSSATKTDQKAGNNSIIFNTP